MCRGPLADATYRRLFAAQVVALVGTGWTTVALTLLAYDLAGDDAGRVVGIALALKLIVYVLVPPAVAGLLAHVPRRRLLVSLDLLRAATVAAMPFADRVWHVYVLIVLVNACSAGFTPTFQATIPDVLGDERRYTQALSLSRLAYELENLLSPALAAALLVAMTYDGLFVANAAAFVASALLVASTRLPARGGAPASGRGRLLGGTRLYLATPRLRGLLALNLAVAAAGAMVIVNTVVYVRDDFGRAASDVAWALGASGAGAMLAALALPRLLERVRDARWCWPAAGCWPRASGSPRSSGASGRWPRSGSCSVSACRRCRRRAAGCCSAPETRRSDPGCSPRSSRSRTRAGCSPTRSRACSARRSASPRRRPSWPASRPSR
jgi:predicted MFS family arabinose efflux permease